MLIVWYWYRNNKRYADIQLSTTSIFENIPVSPRIYLRHILFGLRLLAFALLIIALARPQTSSQKQNVSIEGIDIVMALDVSGSMLAQD